MFPDQKTGDANHGYRTGQVEAADDDQRSILKDVSFLHMGKYTLDPGTVTLASLETQVSWCLLAAGDDVCLPAPLSVDM